MLSNYERYLLGNIFDLDFVDAHAKEHPNYLTLILLCLTSPSFNHLADYSNAFADSRQFESAVRDASSRRPRQFSELLSKIKSCLKDRFSPEFFKCLADFGSNIDKQCDNTTTIAGLKSLSLQNNYDGFYSALILSYFYRRNIGDPSRDEEQVNCLERLVAMIRENECYDDYIVGASLKRYGSISFLNSCRIDFAKLLFSLIQRNISYTWIDYREKVSLITKLERDLGASVPRTMNDKDNKVQQRLSQLRELHVRYKLDFYKNYLKKFVPMAAPSDDDRFYKELNADKELLIQSKETELWEMLASLSDEYYKMEEDKNATLFYILHLEFTSSPASAIQLASMVLASRYKVLDAQRSEDAKIDYLRAAQYYDQAIDYAFERLEFDTVYEAIVLYRKIEQNISKENHLDIAAKIQKCLASFGLCLENQDGIINHTQFLINKKNPRAIKCSNVDLTEVTLTTFINILRVEPLALENIARLRDIYLHAYPKGQALWFWCVGTQFKIPASSDAVSVRMCESLASLLPVITQNLLAENPINLNMIHRLLEVITDIHLHQRNLVSVDVFLEEMSKRLANCFVAVAVNGNLDDLAKLKQIYLLSKNLNQMNNKFVDRLEECDYWLDRLNLERKYDLPVKSDGLNEIYRLANFEKEGRRRPLLSQSYSEQLMTKAHPEAYLKLALLLSLKVQSTSSVAILNEIGTNFVKAAGSAIPQDKLGIYKFICFYGVAELRRKMNGDLSYSKQQRAIVDFYYAVALLIADKKQFYADKLNLFKDRNYLVTVPSILAIFKDNKFEFADAVKHPLLTSIVGIGNVLDDNVVKEATLLLKHTPPDASIISDLERENAALEQEAQGCLDQIARMSALLEEKDRQLALLDDQVKEAARVTPALNRGP